MISLPPGFITYLFLQVALLSFLPLGFPANMQDNQMEMRSSADYIYGQTMNFNLAAANVGDIESVQLFFRLGPSPDSFSVDVPIEPGAQVEATYTLDLTQTRLPPFGSITYWWELSRADGSPLRVPEQVVSYVDDQFTWRQLVVTDEQGGGSVRIHWTGDEESLGDQARNIIFEMLPKIGRMAPLEEIVPFDVYIYPSTADLGAALRLAGRDYSPGMTYPDLGVVLVTVVNPETAEAELRQGLSRGLVDLLLYQGLNQYAYNLPPWLSHGIAGVVRGRRDAVLDDTLRSAAITDTTIAVGELCSAAGLEGDLALAESESLVAYIDEHYGESAVRELITAFAAGEDCPTAMRRALQLTPEQLETAWLRASSGDQGGRTVAEMAVWLILILAGFGLAGLLLIRPRRRRAGS